MIELVVRRRIRATAERLFEAWTQPDQLRLWWGPPTVTCAGATIDLRVGGGYRIGNRYADGRIVWIAGDFEVVAPPSKLVFTWRIEPGPARIELVTVLFEQRDDATDVTVSHQRIADAATRAGHGRRRADSERRTRPRAVARSACRFRQHCQGAQ